MEAVPTERVGEDGGSPAPGLALSFLTAAEKMEIMLAAPIASETEAIGSGIIARRAEAEQPITAELQTALNKLVAGRSGGIPKKMRKPARSGSSPALSRQHTLHENLPPLGVGERCVSAVEVLKAYGYTGSTLPERLPMITCSRGGATASSPHHSRAPNLLSPPSVCSPRPRSHSVMVCRPPTRVVRRWDSTSALGR